MYLNFPPSYTGLPVLPLLNPESSWVLFLLSRTHYLHPVTYYSSFNLILK